MAHSQAAVRVGTVVVLATAALAGLGYFFFGRAVGGYPVDVTFRDAQGIKEQADVLLAGVKVGTVQGVAVDDTGRRAVLHLRIKPDQEIPKGATYTISSGGLLGEMAVMITPPERTAAVTGFLPHSEEHPPVIQGKDLPTFDQLKETVAQLGAGSQDVLDNLKIATSNMAQISNDPVLRRALRNTALNAEQISLQGRVTTARMNQTIGHLNTIIDKEVPVLDATLRNVESLSRQGEPVVGDVRGTIQRVQRLVDDLTTTSQFARQTLQDTLEQADAGPSLNRALKNLADASDEFKVIAADARKISDDLAGTDTATSKVGQTLENVRDVASQANVLLERITGVAGKAGKPRGRLIRGTPQFDVYQRVSGDARFRADLNFALPRADNSAIILGLRDIGEDNTLNLQNSVPVTGRTRLRYGFHASKLSVGADWNIFGNPATPLATSSPGASSVSLDLYDPNDLRLDLYGRHQVNDKLGIVLGFEDIVDHGYPTIGLTYRP